MGQGQIRIPKKGRWAHNNVKLLHFYILTAQVLECPAVTVYQRSDWGAAPVEAGCINEMSTPVVFWFLHHTVIPGFCKDFTECSAAMKEIQRFHQVDRGKEYLGVYSVELKQDSLTPLAYLLDSTGSKRVKNVVQVLCILAHKRIKP